MASTFAVDTPAFSTFFLKKKMASLLSCAPCSKSFSSEVDLQNHLKGGKHKKNVEKAGVSTANVLATANCVSFPSAQIHPMLPAVRKSQEAFATTSHPCLPPEDKSCFICDKVFMSEADFRVHVSSSSHILAAEVFKKAYDMGFHRGLEFAGVSLYKRIELTADRHFDYGGVVFDCAKPDYGSLFDDDGHDPDDFEDFPDEEGSDEDEMQSCFGLKPYEK